MNNLPHNRVSKLIVGESPSKLLKNSMNRWISSLLMDDEIFSKMDREGPLRKAKIISKQDGIYAGNIPIKYLLENWINLGEIEYKVNDGDLVKSGQELMTLSMSNQQILKFERTILNIIGRLSGIATTTHEWKILTPIPLASTRKTTWGLLDKWAVNLGGGLTHRISKNDALMIKENDFIGHNPSESNYKKNITNILNNIKSTNNDDFVIIEVREYDEAIFVAEKWFENNEDDKLTIMLDNMSPNNCKLVHEKLREIGLRNKIILEASGGITLKNIETWEFSKIDVISTSSIHRGTTPLDVSLLITEEVVF